MAKDRFNLGSVLLGVTLIATACGDGGVLAVESSAPTTEAATTTTAPPTTTTQTTVAPTTTATNPTTTTEPASVQCAAAGGLYLAEEGPDGTCYPPDVIAAEAYVIRNVDLDDGDGGLLVWSGPGAPGSKVPQDGKYVETGVIPPYADTVMVTGHATPDDLWYYVRYQGFEGWARSAFLTPADLANPLPPCMTGSSGPIPGSAQAVTSIQANFDGRGGDDTFSVYWDGSDWIAHLRTAYGFHAEMPTGHTGDAPGGGGDVFAGLAYDFRSDGRFEAWVYDTAIMSGEVWSLFAWFNDGCRLHHVTHVDSGGQPQFWTIDATVTHVNSMSCYSNGVNHYSGTANGPDTYAGSAWEHWYEFDDGVHAFWHRVDSIVWNEADGDTIPAGFECP